MYYRSVFGYNIATISQNLYRLAYRDSSTIMGYDVPEISISTATLGNYFRIKIFDPNVARYEVPLTTRTAGRGSSTFEYEYMTSPFRLRVGRARQNMEM